MRPTYKRAAEPQVAIAERDIEANGLRIHYLEAGAGEPLLLLHGGMASTSAAWAGHEWGWIDHLPTLARHFRVIAPHTRAHGGTRNNGTPMSYPLLADDWAALIAALGLEKPLVCGFSDGAISGTVMAIRHPGVARALVNIAGYDVFNPQAHGFTRLRRRMGGGPDATEADPDYFASKSADQEWFQRMVRDVDEAQGEGAWRSLLRDIFPMWTQPMELHHRRLGDDRHPNAGAGGRPRLLLHARRRRRRLPRAAPRRAMHPAPSRPRDYAAGARGRARFSATTADNGVYHLSR